MRLYVYLTVGEDGKAKITKNKPVWARVEGTRRHAPYPRYGEPLEWKGLCMEWVMKAFGELPPPGVPIKLTVDVEPTEPVHEQIQDFKQGENDGNRMECPD